MRVLVHDYAGHPFQVQLSRELIRRGHVVTHAFAGGLVTPRGALTLQPSDTARFQIVEVPMSPDYARHKYNFIRRRGLEVDYGKALARLVREQQPDVVLSGNTPTEPQWRMIREAQSVGAAVVTWIQDFYSLAVDRLARKKLPVIGALAGSFYRWLDARTFQASDGIVVVTEDFLPILTQFGTDKRRVTTLPNWAPLDELPQRPRKNIWSSRHGLDEAFVFHYSGTLAMKHNPDLLRRLALEFRDDPQVRVVVISEGPGAEWLREQIRRERLENLIVLPFQSFSEMPEVLSASDALIAILEPDAGAFSVPSKVLTYNCAGRPILAAIPAQNLAARTIHRERTGMCVAPDDITGFITYARRLREDAELRARMGAAARAYAQRTFDIDSIGGRFESVLVEALEHCRGAKAKARASEKAA
jgi:colanic acid biosynthesis glycosyl transferase WcaI